MAFGQNNNLRKNNCHKIKALKQMNKQHNACMTRGEDFSNRYIPLKALFWLELISSMSCLNEQLI